MMTMEKKDYYTLAEAAEITGKSRATLYKYIHALDIQTHKFKRDKRFYLARRDVERLKAAKEQPWLLGEEPK